MENNLNLNEVDFHRMIDEAVERAIGGILSGCKSDTEQETMYKNQTVCEEEELSWNDCDCFNREIVVNFDSESDFDNLDAVRVEAYPDDEDQGMNDAVALLYAAAKRLSETCPAVDGEAYCEELLKTTEHRLRYTVLTQLLGGADCE